MSETIEMQRKTGFDIFFQTDKLDDIILDPDQEEEYSFVLASTQYPSNIPSVISLPFRDVPEYGELEEAEPSFLEIPVTCDTTEISFKVSPRNLFLNDCCKDQLQTKKFFIKNRCSHKLPIVIYPPENISIKTPGPKNYIEINPHETISLTLTHMPTEIGQFNHKIFFDCILTANQDPQVMKLMTSVSPPEIPRNFPVITPENSLIYFGEIHAGTKASESFTINNPGDDVYNVTIVGVLDIFINTPSLQTTASSSLVLNSKNAPSQISFRNASSSISQSTLSIKLQPHSGITIFAEYCPAFHFGVDTQTFDHRTFMIALTFVDNTTNSTYYRRIKCKSSICHSTISATPTTIDFCDTTVVRSNQTATITVNNPCPLSTTVRISPSSRSLVVPPGPLVIPANSSSKFTVTFYPKRIDPDYNSTIVIINENNPSNELHISVTAIVVAEASETLHSMSYSLLCDGSHITSFDLKNCSTNFSTIKSFSIKNRTSSPLTLRLSSTTNEICFYHEIEPPVSELSSSNSLSNSSPSLHISPNEFSLINENSKITSLKQIEYLMKINSTFFQDLFSLLGHYTEDSLIEHFISLKTKLSALLSNENVIKLNDIDYEIPPQGRIEVFIILTPQGNSLLWKHRVEKLLINLLNQKEEVKPLELPIIFNEAMSAAFLSSHSLHFGTLQRNNVYQRKIYLMNESALPLLFNFESDSIVFEKKKCGIVLPFNSVSAPFSLCPKIDGEMLEKIVVRNVLNPCDDQEIRLRGTVFRRSNFIIDPNTLDFGVVTAGQSSKRILIFITNTSNYENEFTFSHTHKDSLLCKPLITYQFKNSSSNSRRLNESIALQIEKLEQKLRILKRKNKTAYAAQVQHLLDNLSEQKQGTTNAQLKHMDAKYMDRVTFHAAPLQMICIEIQLIPSVSSGKRLTIDSEIEGAILVYERGRNDTQKIIHYNAHVIPEAQRLFDSMVKNSITVEPSSFSLEHVYVQECKSVELKIKNVSNTTQNYWISSDSTRECIITSPKSEGTIKPQEIQEIRVDIFCMIPGNLTKSMVLTTQTSSQTISFQIHSEYQKILSFPGLPENKTIDFGNFPMTSLQIIEERSSISICNTSANPVYVSIINSDEDNLLIYEQDPREPQSTPFLLEPNATSIMNILMEPQIDPAPYHRYRTKIIDATLTIKAYETLEEAEESSGCLSQDEIKVTAKLGRIGLHLSNPTIDFGTVKKETLSYKLKVKNRSSHIPFEVFTNSSQGIIVNPSVFSIEGKKIGENTKEIELKFTPSSDGVNDGKVQFTINGVSSYTKTLNVTAFVDPGIIKTDLPVDDKMTDIINIGELYVNNGKPVQKPVSLKLTNTSNISITIDFCEQRFTIGSKRTQTVHFNFPFPNYVYNPEEPKFSYRLACKSLTTHRILKIIDVVGEFVVSIGALSEENISLGRFGKFNNYNYEEKYISIINKANIPLIVKPSCKPPLLQIQDIKIPPILPNEKFDFNLIPDISKLQTVEGNKVVFLSFINQQNMQNVMKATVTFDVLSTMLQFGRTETDKNEVMSISMNKFTKYTVPDEESETGTSESFIANSWFSISNKQNTECSVTFESENLMPDIIAIDIFLRKSDVKISEIDLQPGETVEVRVKAYLKKVKGFDMKSDYHFANLIVKSENNEPTSLRVKYHPKE